MILEGSWAVSVSYLKRKDVIKLIKTYFKVFAGQRSILTGCCAPENESDLAAFKNKSCHMQTGAIITSWLASGLPLT